MYTKNMFYGFNFKLYPESKQENYRILKGYINILENLPNLSDKQEIVVFSPFVFLENSQSVLMTIINKEAKIFLGSQDVSVNLEGNYTGEVSSPMLKSLGVKYALVGHSEVRKINKLNEKDIFLKLINCWKTGIIPILCVGYQDNDSREIDYQNLKKQLSTFKKAMKKIIGGDNSLYEKIDFSKEDLPQIIIAFEPTFAIGNGRPATIEQLKTAINYINKEISVFKPKIIYGGSINSKNIKEYLNIPNLEGFLIGKVSLNINEVEKIIMTNFN